MPEFKRSQAKYVKKPYKISNWSEYEKSLRQRGSLTIWISDDAIDAWNSEKSGKLGAPEKYSDLAIETALTVRTIYNLRWRQTCGFIQSLFDLLLIDLDVPHHTTFSRRSKNLGDIKYIEQGSLDKYLNLYIDSSGLSTHNGNQRKPTKNKSWRKFHIAVDGKGNIVASELTSNKATDASRVKRLMSKVEKPLTSASADSAYDNNQVYSLLSDHLKNKNSKILIPPKKNSIASDKSHPQRNRNIRSRDRYGKRTWIKKSKYNLRNRVENTFFRYKQIIGPTLKARTLQGQRVEMQIGCKIQNTMTALGMPQSSLRK